MYEGLENGTGLGHNGEKMPQVISCIPNDDLWETTNDTS